MQVCTVHHSIGHCLSILNTLFNAQFTVSAPPFQAHYPKLEMQESHHQNIIRVNQVCEEVDTSVAKWMIG